MYILGIWDGHDSGAALLDDGKIVFATNEERYTKRKLEVKFPYNSIEACLHFAKIKPSEIEHIAFTTTEFAKTMSRVLPYQMEHYYKLRRRKLSNKGMDKIMLRTRNFQYKLKYAMNMVGKLPLCGTISKSVVARHLRHMGFRNFKLYVVDHHTAHASTAAFASGFKSALVVTMDGYGDGLSGTISLLENGELRRVHATKARDSLGIIYEQVTNLVGMRENEDEGKVMAMADYSFPFKFEDNKLRHLITVDGLEMRAKYGALTQYRVLGDIAWSTPREQLAYYVQQLVEQLAAKYFSNAIERYKMGNVAMAGGIFSNVKMNRQIRLIDGLKNWFVFPHMGDGGMAMGAAMYTNYLLNGVTSYKFDDAYLGDGFSDGEIEAELKKVKGIEFHEDKSKSSHAAELIENDNYVFWFDGRMEYGPRALGNRSILAKADSETVKDKLNLYVKQREWYQPFAPAMLRDDASKLLSDIKGYDKFMTMAYMVKPEAYSAMQSVMHVDHTARPQMVGEENKAYKEVLEKIRKKSGYGVMLNTSFNIHGAPIVRSPEDAVETMLKTRTRHMFIGGFYVENKLV